MSSCLLYHGPGAKEAALKEGLRLGRLMCPPMGEGGLKVDEARQVTDLLMSPPVGDQLGVLLIGPIDEANPKAADTLLKCIEESSGDYVQAIMWANDLGSVVLTLRSRCLERWAPAALGQDDDESAMAGAYQIIEAVLKKDALTIVSSTRSFEKREGALLTALSEVLASNMNDPQHLMIWGHLRQVTQWKSPWLSEILVALLKAGHQHGG